MRCVKPVLYIVFTLLALASPAWAGRTFYVEPAPTGNDSRTVTQAQTESTPWATLTHCIGAATTPGDTCLVKNGTYTLNGANTINWTGTSSAPITYKNYPGHTPVLRSDNRDTPSYQMFIFQPSPYPAVGNPGGPSPSFFVIEGFEIKDFYYAVKINWAHDIIIRNNIIHHSGAEGIQGYGYNLTIDRNTFYHNAYVYTPPYFGYDLYLTGQNISVTNNVMSDASGFCMQLDGGADPMRPSDLFAGFSGRFSNNTCAFSQARAGLTIWGGGNECCGPVHDLTVDNNIFLNPCYNDALCSDANAGAIRFYNIAPTTPVHIYNNLYYNNAAGCPACPFILNQGCGANCYTTSGNIIGTDPNLYGGTPSTPSTPPNYHLTSGSAAARDAGLNLASQGITVDRDGVSRPQGSGYDIGAYEYDVGGADTTPPAAPSNFVVQ